MAIGKASRCLSGRSAMLLVILFSTLLFTSVAQATVYNIGPGQTYTTIGAMPWESLAAGDTVNIHYSATPYREKFVIGAVGTQSQPITIHGVPDGSGNLPIIDGQNATTRLQLETGSETRGLITMQQYTTVPASCRPAYITIENLEFRNASKPYTFTDDGGAVVSYVDSSAAIWLADGRNITVRNCYMHDCGNGFFTYSADSGADNWTQDIVLEGCYITACGNAGRVTEHDSYCESLRITYQYNHYGPPRGSDTQSIGNALKDRSAGMVVRYNWFDGGNRALDIVDPEDSSTLGNDASYQKSYMYGNVMIERNDVGNRQVVHFGGDMAGVYRPKGYFYNNTVISNRTGTTTLVMENGGSSSTFDCRNNVLYVSAAGNTLEISNDSDGVVNMTHNWLKTGYVLSGSGGGTVNDDGTSVTGTAPGFVDVSGQDYHLAAGSACINAGTTLHADCSSYPVSMQYVKHQSSETRPNSGALDIGAFEYGSGGALTITTASLPNGQMGAAYSQTLAASGGTTPYTWAIASGSLPSGLSLGSSTGTISGTPTGTGTSSFTARVTDNVAATATKALSITVNAATLSITTASLPAGTVGTAYSQTLAATGGVTPYTWAISAGSLPSGLSLAASTGVISGTPTTAQTSSFTARVTDNAAATATKALSITINSAPSSATYQFNASDSEATTTSTSWQTKATVTFTPNASDDWLIFGFAEYKGSSTSYSALIRMTVDGVSEGEITVEPTVAADYQSFVTAKKATLSSAAHTIALQYASENAAATAYIRNARVVAVRKSALEMYSTAADSAVALTTTMTNYASQAFTPASAGDYLLVWSAETSANTAYSTLVEARLNGVASDSCIIETKDNADYATFAAFTVANLPASAQTITVAAAKESTSTATHNIRRARVSAIRLSGSRLTGYQFASADGESTTTSTTFQQKLTKSWSVGTAGNWLVLSSFRLANSSASYNVEGLVQLDNATTMAQPLRRPKDATDYMNAGSVDVRSLAAGTRFVDVDYRSSSASGTAKIKLARVTALPLDGASIGDLVITTTTLPNGQIGVAYSQTLAATGGQTPYTWSVLSGSLPSGLSLGSSTGIVSGTPTGAGTSSFTVRVTDSQGTPDTDDQALSITIPADLSVTTSSLPAGQVGIAYSQTLSASGGTSPYSWSLSSGTLPSGLSLSSGGVISGTPSGTGTSNFTVRVTDAQTPADSATRALSIVVNPATLTITTTTLPNGTVSTAYSQTLAATGGATPYTWAVYSGSLPTGLSLGSSTGTISGTPTTAQTANFTVRVTDSLSATDTQALAITINSGGGSFNVTLQDGVNGYTGTSDDWMTADYATTNYGTGVNGHLQYNTQDRQVFMFDLSSIPSNATITSATLSFYVYTVSGGTPNVGCYRILKQWDEMQVTYNNRLTGTAWGTPGLLSGTDYTATAIATSGNISAAGWANFTITSQVQSWVNGSQANYGVMFRETSAGHCYTRMSDYTTDTTLRPKLVVSYTTP